MTQPANCFFLYLTNAFTGQIEFGTDFFQCQAVVDSNPEKQFYYIALSVRRLTDATTNALSPRSNVQAFLPPAGEGNKSQR